MITGQWSVWQMGVLKGKGSRADLGWRSASEVRLKSKGEEAASATDIPPGLKPIFLGRLVAGLEGLRHPNARDREFRYLASLTCSRASLYVPNCLATGFRVG